MRIPRVSVLIDTYNYGHFVEEAVGSVLAQDFPGLGHVLENSGMFRLLEIEIIGRRNRCRRDGGGDDDARRYHLRVMDQPGKAYEETDNADHDGGAPARQPTRPKTARMAWFAGSVPASTSSASACSNSQSVSRATASRP